MRRAILLIALLALTACSDDDSATADSSSDTPIEQVANKPASHSSHYTARLTCQTSGMTNQVYVCLANDGGISPVKITSGSNTKIYSNIQDFGMNEVNFPINGDDFSIIAQNGSCMGCVLRLEILDSSGNIVGSDEASTYGFVSFSS